METGRDAAKAQTAYETKVLRAFLVDGRLERIPAKQKKKQVILRFLARTDFHRREEVTEREVDRRLALRHPDVAALRRNLVENRYMERGGGIDRLLPEDGWPTLDALDAWSGREPATSASSRQQLPFRTRSSWPLA